MLEENQNKCRQSLSLKATCRLDVCGGCGACSRRTLLSACNGGRFDFAMLFGKAIAHCQTPYDGGFKVALGFRRLRCVSGKCDCNLLDTPWLWVQGSAGL